MSLVIFIGLLKSHIKIVTFKNAVQTNKYGGFNFCLMVLKYSIVSLLITTKMLIYFVLPLVVSFSCNRQLKMSDFEKNVMYPDGHKDGHTERQAELFFKISTYIHMRYDPCQLFVSQTLS